MTVRMPDDQLDREIRSFLASQAEDINDAPSTMEVAARISSRVGTNTHRLGPTPRLGRVVLVGLLMLSLFGALVAGALLLRKDPPPLSSAYEAVFLRLEVAAGEPIVHVIGVRTDGAEREIAALLGAWVNDLGTGYPRPIGAVSASGLLAIPSSTDDIRMTMRWEIFDLLRPTASPMAVPGIIQNVEQLPTLPYFPSVLMPVGPFWGPGDRVAIAWDLLVGDPDNITDWKREPQVSFVDGRTGAATSVPVPDSLRLLVQWAADGSGVMVSDKWGATPVGVLRSDGSVDMDASVRAEGSCRTRFRSGDEITSTGEIVPGPVATGDEGAAGRSGFACLAPDESAIIRHLEHVGSGSVPHLMAELIVPSTGLRLAIEGSFAGWLDVSR